MKHTIEGFLQTKLIELNLNCEDAVLLRWLMDFSHSPKVQKIINDDKVYFWVHYPYARENITILKINSDKAFGERLLKLAKAGIIEKYSHKTQNGSKQYVQLTDKIDELVGNVIATAAKPAVPENPAVRENGLPEIPCIATTTENLRSVKVPAVRNNPQCIINNDSSINSINNKKINKKDSEDVLLIFEYWQTIMGKNKAQLDDKRSKIINRALKAYSADDLKRAIDGCAKSDWHMGRNNIGAKYNELSNIFGDSEKTDRFIELSGTKRPVSNSHDLRDQDYDNAQDYFAAPVNQECQW